MVMKMGARMAVKNAYTIRVHPAIGFHSITTDLQEERNVDEKKDWINRLIKTEKIY